MAPGTESATLPSRYSVLIVEDEDLNLKLLIETFKKDYNVIGFASPKEALEHVKSQKPRVDLVITDQRMPSMSGIEFLDQLSQFYPKAIKMILTGSVKTNDLMDAINKAQVYRYITKPAEPNHLRQEVKQAFAAFERYQDELQQVSFDHVGDAIVTISDDGKIESMNKAAERLFGYPLPEIMGQSFKMLFYEAIPTKYGEYFDALKGAKTEPRPTLRETTGLRKDGSTIPLDLTITQALLGEKSLYVICARSAQKRKLVEEQSKYQAYHDLLTGIPNRRLFVDRLTIAVANASRHKQLLAVICFNLDRFKIINNTLGFAIGDQLLENVSKRLSRCIREGDTVARFAADEFGILLPHIRSAEDAARFAQRAMESIGLPFTVENRELYVTTSIGISFFPSDGTNAETLLTNANAALTAAKSSGGNTCRLFNPELNMMALDRLVFEGGLRKAIERQELLLYFQPILDAASLSVRSAEALVRWKHPELGFVPPGLFIPVAEETGLIGAIGEWVLRAACIQSKKWDSKGMAEIPVAVNVSTKQFKEEKFVDTVIRVLKETGIDPHRLELEVTESLMMENVEASIQKLQNLKNIGIQLCIDDFGTGYSSFNYLKRFPIDVLKIDQSFVRDLTTSPNDAAIASAIIDIAHRLKLKVVAEGVETKEQLAFLRSQSCDRLQGFLFSQPQPPDELLQMLLNGQSLSWQKLLEN